MLEEQNQTLLHNSKSIEAVRSYSRILNMKGKLTELEKKERQCLGPRKTTDRSWENRINEDP